MSWDHHQYKTRNKTTEHTPSTSNYWTKQPNTHLLRQTIEQNNLTHTYHVKLLKKKNRTHTFHVKLLNKTNRTHTYQVKLLNKTTEHTSHVKVLNKTTEHTSHVKLLNKTTEHTPPTQKRSFFLYGHYSLSDHTWNIVKYYCIPPPLKRGHSSYKATTLYQKLQI